MHVTAIARCPCMALINACHSLQQSTSAAKPGTGHQILLQGCRCLLRQRCCCPPPPCCPLYTCRSMPSSMHRVSCFVAGLRTQAKWCTVCMGIMLAFCRLSTQKLCHKRNDVITTSLRNNAGMRHRPCPTHAWDPPAAGTAPGAPMQQEARATAPPRPADSQQAQCRGVGADMAPVRVVQPALRRSTPFTNPAEA